MEYDGNTVLQLCIYIWVLFYNTVKYQVIYPAVVVKGIMKILFQTAGYVDSFFCEKILAYSVGRSGKGKVYLFQSADSFADSRQYFSRESRDSGAFIRNK